MSSRARPAVFVLEPQTLFVSELTQTIARCGGNVIRVADVLDTVEIAAMRADMAVLDLDYASNGVLERLAIVRGAAPPNMHLVVVTGEHGPGWVYRFRHAGACGVISKASPAREFDTALRRILSGALYYDPRVDAA